MSYLPWVISLRKAYFLFASLLLESLKVMEAVVSFQGLQAKADDPSTWDMLTVRVNHFVVRSEFLSRLASLYFLYFISGICCNLRVYRTGASYLY